MISYLIKNNNSESIHKNLGYLAAVYTFVCAIRAIWLRKDVSKICFFNKKYLHL